MHFILHTAVVLPFPSLSLKTSAKYLGGKKTHTAPLIEEVKDLLILAKNIES